MELTAADRQEEPASREMPRLRQDIGLHPGPRNLDGRPTWLLHDPVRNQYFQLDRIHVEMVRHWGAGDAQAIGNAIKRAIGEEVSESQIGDFSRFLVESELVEASDSATRSRIQRIAALKKKSLFNRLLHGYLFFRIPLIRPDRFLDWLYPLVRPLISLAFVRVTALVGMLAMFLILQRWDSFTHSLSWFFTAQGMIVFFLTLLVIKIIHEFGHAIMAKHYGLSVPTMGVAFMVMWPVLYTDATNAWRLPHRKGKALISAAGVITELMLACYAMLAWIFLPDGLARSIAFTVATTTWILSLAVNLNPLMRFDGYFFLSDALNVPNLQERSFRMARWQLRSWLFGYNVPPPERMEDSLRKILVVFGISVWVYRFFLFLGIALLVYHLFFKVLGVFLFLVEIWYFIVRPVRNELVQWKEIIPTMRGRRRAIWIGAGVLSLFILLYPFRQTVVLPAHMVDQQFFRIYPAETSRIVEVLVANGQKVNAGDVLIRLHSPDVAHELELAVYQENIVKTQLANAIGDEKRLSERLVLEQALERTREEKESLRRLLDNLIITAPVDGHVVDLHPEARAGRWLAPNFHLLTVTAGQTPQVQAWARESELAGLEQGGSGRFYPASGMRMPVVPLRISEIESSALAELDVPYHASIYGGEIPVTADREGRLVPAESLYRIHLEPADNDATPVPPLRLKGYVHLEGQRRSYLSRFFRLVVGTIVREAGF